MIQLVVNGIFLDLYENDPPKLTYSIEDISDTSITTVYSKNFRVPATKNNNAFFKTAFEVNGFDFDVTTKIDATILVDGNEIRKGQIRLQRIYLTNGGDAADYELLFLGETRTLASEIGDKLVSQLDFTPLNIGYTFTNVTQSWQAYPQSSSLTAGIVSGNLIFPLVDFGNTYSGSNNDIEQGSPTLGGSKSFLTSTNGISLYRFKPMVRAKYVWDQIFSGSNFQYQSEFLESELFHQLYMSAWGNEESITVPTTTTSNTFKSLLTFDWKPFEAPFATADGSWLIPTINTEDPGNNFGNAGAGIFTAPLNGSYKFTYSIPHTIKFDVSDASWLINNFDSLFTFRLRKDVSGTITTIASNAWAENTTDGSGNPVYDKSGVSSKTLTGKVSRTITVTLNAGDKVFVDVQWLEANNTDVQYLEVDRVFTTFNCVSGPGDFSVVPAIKNDYKQIDFIKDISTKFRLVFARDRYVQNKFIIEPWSDYIGSGDILQWSDKLDLSKDITIEPVFNTQNKVINFADKADGDYWNKYNEDVYKEVFGYLKVDSENELLKGERKIETSTSPTIMKQLRDWTLGNGNAESFIIPHVYTVQNVEGKTLYKPIVPNTRFLFYNGLVDPGNISGDVTPSWYMLNESNASREIVNQYPKVSPYSTAKIGIGTIDLNWQRESGYFYDPDNTDTGQIGQTVYDIYWLGYVNSLYDKWARKVSAYFILDSTDLVNFSFSDVVFVKGNYYYVEKIYDAPLGEKESIKVDLIKLQSFQVPSSGFIPPTPITPFNVWGTWGVIWNTTTDGWDD